MRLQSNWCERSSWSAAAETSAEPDFPISNQRRSFSASGHRTRWDSMLCNRSEKSGEKEALLNICRARDRGVGLGVATSRIVKGEALAAEAHCLSCHIRAGGQPFGGGYGVNTPFGIIYGSNITPDPKTCTSAWSLEAFSRSAFSEQGSGVVRRFLSKALGVLK